jgi:hypothetical protein
VLSRKQIMMIATKKLRIMVNQRGLAATVVTRQFICLRTQSQMNPFFQNQRRNHPNVMMNGTMNVTCVRKMAMFSAARIALECVTSNALSLSRGPKMSGTARIARQRKIDKGNLSK